MNDPERNLLALGSAVGAALDVQREAIRATDIARDAMFPPEAASARDSSAAGTSLLGTTRRRALPRVLLAAACLVLGVLGVFLAVDRWSGALTFEASGVVGRTGVWLEPQSHLEIPVQFSDGTTLLLMTGSRARVGEIDRRGAQVELERGRASVSVVHKSSARWMVKAGPFEVVVTGTRFDLSWDPPSGRFLLVMHDGSVELRAPGVAPRRVVAGQVVGLSAWTTTASSVAAPSLVFPIASATVNSADSELPAPSLSGSVVSSSNDIAPRSIASDWALESRDSDFRGLARGGKYSEALVAADKVGFDGLVASGTAPDLLLLGDIARYNGRSDRALQAYRAVRSRYGGSEEAARAVYFMGLMSFPASSCVQHFEAYLRERPGGALAGEAMGRIMDAYQRGGNPAAAKAAAVRYLASFPAGPQAALARSIAER